MTELTHEDIMKAMEARSDQLNAVDLIAGPITVKIVNARKGDDKKQIVVLDIEGYKGKPFKPCKTMLRIMAEVWKHDTDTKMRPERWIGQSMTLYRDPDVKWQGDKVGGIRISHLSGLDEPRVFLVTETRGRTVEKVIHPIKTSVPSPPGVTQERLDWLKVGWAKEYADICGQDKDENSRLFTEWVQQTLDGNFNPGGEQGVNEKTSWSSQNMEQCEKALNAAEAKGSE